MTRPERSDVNVTGTYAFNDPVNETDVIAVMAAMTATRIAVHQAVWRPYMRDPEPIGTNPTG